MKKGDRVKVVKYIAEPPPIVNNIRTDNERFHVVGQNGTLLRKSNLPDMWAVDLDDNGHWDYWLLKESELEVIKEGN